MTSIFDDGVILVIGSATDETAVAESRTFKYGEIGISLESIARTRGDVAPYARPCTAYCTVPESCPRAAPAASIALLRGRKVPTGSSVGTTLR